MQCLLVIGYVWPEPNSSAAGSHMLSLLQVFLDRDWRVVFASPAADSDFNLDLSQQGIERHNIQINDSNFDNWIKHLDPQMVLFDRFMMEEQFGWRVADTCPNALRILDTEDLQCLRQARQQAHKEQRKFQLTDLNSDLCKREIASIYRCDLSLIISSFEMQLLTEHFKLNESILHHLPFMLGICQIKTSLPSFEQRQHFISIGNFRHAPNWDSVLYLKQLWPQIRKQLPQAELHIYGAYTPPKATALNDPKQGFIIKDRAKEVDPVMQNARVCLAPLRFGAGIKGKLIDAMRCATPSVTTDIGAEGMSFAMPWPGIIATEESDFIAAAVELYQHPDRWQHASQACLPLLKKHYDKEKLAPHFYQSIESLLGQLDSHRQGNFIGQMLSFHSLRSTKYMSKWIEAKNRS
ncbi:MAG: glycosyltransferase family 4 protein [Enterobacterales bacterium]|nr:glycosyltransferase family 4 protein [Enterobacterales bacterium]